MTDARTSAASPMDHAILDAHDQFDTVHRRLQVALAATQGAAELIETAFGGSRIDPQHRVSIGEGARAAVLELATAVADLREEFAVLLAEHREAAGCAPHQMSPLEQERMRTALDELMRVKREAEDEPLFEVASASDETGGASPGPDPTSATS